MIAFQSVSLQSKLLSFIPKKFSCLSITAKRRVTMRLLSLAVFTSTVLAVAVQQPRQGPVTSMDIAIDSTLVKKGLALAQSKREPGGDDLDDDVDDLLDEIDSVLEENAEEFVRSYVQKGGQKQ